MKKIKATLQTKFNEYGCTDFKKRIALEAGCSVQYVRKFFREENWPHEGIEQAAHTVLKRAKKEYEQKLNQLESI